MNLTDRFLENIKAQDLFSRKDSLLLAISGGIDSVVLCDLCHDAGFDFTLAHCNFQLRNEESDRDEEFVKQLAIRYGVDVFVKRFDAATYATNNKVSIQEAARVLRYTWFEELIRCETDKEKPMNGQSVKKKLDIVLTAHHADDNIETLLMNLCRGTGLQGLTGIPVRAGHIRRPLLEFSKEELISYAKERNLAFVEDSSNLSEKYTRNFFRHEIIPALARAYPQVRENLYSTIKRFKEINHLYRHTLDALKMKLCRQKGVEIHIPIKQLFKLNNRALIYEIISEHGFSEKQVDEVLKLGESDSGHFIENERMRIIKHRRWFIVAPKQDHSLENIIIEEKQKTQQLSMGRLQISRLPISECQVPKGNMTVCLDAKDIQFPMLLRKWKTGDYFYPLGMRKKKNSRGSL